MPAIRPTSICVLGTFGCLFAIQNVHGYASFGGRTNDRAKRVRDAPAAADHFSQIVGMNDQLDHRLRAFVHKEFDRDGFGIRNEFAREKREQLRCPPVARPGIA
jgi:hypothetical protein